MSAVLPPQRICFVGASCSVHTQKWCEWFSKRGHDVHVATFDDVDLDTATVHHLELADVPYAGDPRKIAYLSRARRLRRILDELEPDIVHAHYASSYGTLTALSSLRPYYLSMWGSDIYSFPKASPLHKLMLQFSLARATWLMSTSDAMAHEAAKYTSAPIDITPFGVDTNVFIPSDTRRDLNSFAVGTVKGLKDVYGIDTLLRGCAHALAIDSSIPLRVRIAGRGPEEAALKSLAASLGLAERIDWLGFVDPQGVPAVWGSLDVALIPSNSESFGVAAVEAQACGVPVVASNLPGLLEAVSPSMRSLSIDPGDSDALGEVIVDLYREPEKRIAMGRVGRDFAVSTYSLESCFGRVEDIYARNLEK